MKKSIRNLIRKQLESQRKKMAQTLRLSMFQSLINLSPTRITPLEKAIKTAIDMISSNLSIDPLPRRPNHSLTDASCTVSFFFSIPFFDRKASLGASRGDLGPSRPVLGSSGPFLGRSWDLLAPLGVVLGSCWAVLGRSWSPLTPPVAS